jgi:hypothetical protein
MAKIVLAELDIDIQAMLKSASEVKQVIDGLKNNQKALAEQGDTSSKQFVQNAADLKVLSTEYNASVKAIAGNTKATADNANRTELLALALGQEVQSIAEAREQNKLLNKLRNETNLTTEQGAADVLALNKALDLNNDFIKDNADAYLAQKINIGNYSGSMKEALQTMNPFNGGIAGFTERAQAAGGVMPLMQAGLKGVTAGIRGATVASLAFIATPLGAVLAIIAGIVAVVVGAFKFMTASMNSTEAGSQKLAKVTAAISGVFQGLFMVVKPLGEFMGKVFIKYFELAAAAVDKAMKVISEGLKLLGFDSAAKGVDKFSKAMSDGSKAAVDLAVAQGKLDIAQRQAQKTQLDYQKSAEKLRQIRDDESLTMSQRIQANKDLGIVLKNQLKDELAIAYLALDTANKRVKAEDKSKEALDQQAEALTKISDIQERVSGQESEQLVNTNSLRKEGADKAKEYADKATEANNKRIDNLIGKSEQEFALLQEKNRFESESLETQKMLATEEVKILNQKLKNKRISQTEYETEKLRIENDIKQKATENETAELERLKTFNDKKKELQNQLDIEKTAGEAEKAALKLTQDLEKHLAELELIKATETEKNELRKLITEQYNLDVQALTDKAATEMAQKQADFNIKEINYQQQKNDIQVGLAQQLGNSLLSVLGDSLGAQLAAIALDAILQIVKIRIATSAAQQINLANATALVLTPLGPAAYATALATNAALGASSKLQQAGILASAAVSAGTTVAKKFESGGIQEVGGNRHSQGGTMFYGSDGTTFEAEQGEGIGVLNRGAFASFMDFNNNHSSGGVSRPNFMAGGGIITQGVQSNTNNLDMGALLQAIQSLPAPVVSVQEFHNVSNNLVRVVNGADF